VNDNQTLATALESLPHGPEFRFIDKLLTLDPGKAGTAQYTVKENDFFLRGHFPGHPVMPGVLIVEAAAQLAGTVAQSDPTIPPLPGLKLTAFRAIKILGTAKPGETIQLEAKVRGRLANLIQAEVIASVNGAVVLTGEVTLSGAS
jgi:3-hydroxyacyl-[acyl-carrier-protein] dehydratase